MGYATNIIELGALEGTRFLGFLAACARAASAFFPDYYSEGYT
jgi:hypothetical protein